MAWTILKLTTPSQSVEKLSFTKLVPGASKVGEGATHPSLHPNFKSHEFCPVQVVQLVGASFYTPIARGFNSQSGHMPRLRAWSLVRCAQETTDWCSLSHWCFSLSLPLALKAINISSWVRIKKTPEFYILFFNALLSVQLAVQHHCLGSFLKYIQISHSHKTY